MIFGLWKIIFVLHVLKLGNFKKEHIGEEVKRDTVRDCVFNSSKHRGEITFYQF